VRKAYERDVKIFFASLLALQNILQQFTERNPQIWHVSTPLRTVRFFLPFFGHTNIIPTALFFLAIIFILHTYFHWQIIRNDSHPSENISHRTQTHPSSHNFFIKCRLRLYITLGTRMISFVLLEAALRESSLGNSCHKVSKA
jgi:predicted small integral membrane protein